MSEINREALEYLVTLGVKTPNIKTISEDAENKTLLITKADGTSEIREYKKEVKGLFHTITDLNDFIAFIDEHMESELIVFVGETQIFADNNYGNNYVKHVSCPLTQTESYQCLVKLFSGATQKDLWRMLVSKLDGCFDPSLECYIGSIQVSQNTEKKIEIANTGIESGTANRAQRITFQPTSNANIQSLDIPMNWTWKGKVFECFESVAEIDFRLEIELVDGQMKFIFHPKRLEEKLREQRSKIVEFLKNELGIDCVYQGTF